MDALSADARRLRPDSTNSLRRSSPPTMPSAGIGSPAAVIVLDASTLVRASMSRGGRARPGGAPCFCVRQGCRVGAYDGRLRDEVLTLIDALGPFVTPTDAVRGLAATLEDDKCGIALAARAGVIVSGDDDLLVLHPWRGVRILRPADYLAEVEPTAGG